MKAFTLKEFKQLQNAMNLLWFISLILYLFVSPVFFLSMVAFIVAGGICMYRIHKAEKVV